MEVFHWKIHEDSEDLIAESDILEGEEVNHDDADEVVQRAKDAKIPNVQHLDK